MLTKSLSNLLQLPRSCFALLCRQSSLFKLPPSLFKLKCQFLDPPVLVVEQGGLPLFLLSLQLVDQSPLVLQLEP